MASKVMSMEARFSRFIRVVVLIVGMAGFVANVCEAGENGRQDREAKNEWVDTYTGHRVIRLSRREGQHRSFYFHNNPFIEARSDEGDKMVFYGLTPERWQLFTVNLKTLKIEQLTYHEGGVKGEIVARKRREVIYYYHNMVFATHVDMLVTREVVRLPEDFAGRPATINADETLLAGAYAESIKRHLKKPRREWFREIFEAKLPNHIFTINLETGNVKKIYRTNTWLNHLQFSPTDPGLLMFCHEGPWHELHRIWLIRSDGTGLRKIHERSIKNEIAGHEFWSPDGKRVWFDLQIPRGRTFFLAGASIDIDTGEETRYQLERDEWSVHYNVSKDGSMFCGDGGGAKSVARAENGKWIYLFRPDGGKLRMERLCSLAAHDYNLEPNVHFTPDGKWVVFRSNMHGHSQIYAVEVTRNDSDAMPAKKP